MSAENIISLAALPRPGKRPVVKGIAVGDTVVGTLGRRFKVIANDEYVCVGEQATGPYARLQALDACKAVATVIWPRDWYCKAGENMDLFGAAV